MTQRDEGHNYRDSKNRAMEYERKQKYKAIIDMVIRWLDSNIDEWQANDLLNDPRIEIKNAVADDSLLNDPRIEIKNAVADDSRDLKEKIELALDPSTTKREIEDGDL
jgi:hypothetical protein